MRAIRIATLALALGALLAPSDTLAGKKPKPKVLMKIATLAPDGSTWMNLMHEMDDRVREATGNEVGFKFYAGGVQGDEKIVLRKMRNGQLHGGGFTGNGLGVIAPSLRVLEVPFLLQDERELDAVRHEFAPEFEATLREAGYELIGWAEVGFVHLFTRRPVRELTDLRSAKMWLWEGDPLAEAFFRAAGVAPVSLSITDVYTSLQTGLVDGVYSSPYAGVVLQWHTQVSAMSELPISHAIGAVIVSEKTFRKISPESQAKIREIAADVFARLNASTRRDNRTAIDSIREAGIEIVSIPEAAMKTFRTIGADAAASLVGELYSQELLQSVQRVVAERRASAATEAEEQQGS